MNENNGNYGRQLRLVAKFFYTAMEKGFLIMIIGEVDGVSTGVKLNPKDPIVKNILEDFCQGLNAYGLMYEEGLLKNAPTAAAKPEISSIAPPRHVDVGMKTGPIKRAVRGQ